MDTTIRQMARNEHKQQVQKKSAPTPVEPEILAAVIANLKGRGNSRPRRVRTLASTIKSLSQLGLNNGQVAAIIAQLRLSGKVVVTDENVAYKL